MTTDAEISRKYRKPSTLWRQSNITTLSVIREVRLRPLLWNKCHELYKDREARLQAWREVSCAVVPNYTALKCGARVSSDTAVQQRWRTARDTYIKSRTAPASKKYMYSDYLRFLDNTTGPPGNLNDIEDWPSSPPRLPALPSSSSSDGTIKTEIADTKHTVKRHNNKKNECNNRVKYRFKRKRGTDVSKEEILKILQDSLIQMKDDNMAFFVSLLPIISKFTNYQRIQFRSEVLNAALHISNMDPLSIPSTSDSTASISSPF